MNLQEHINVDLGVINQPSNTFSFGHTQERGMPVIYRLKLNATL